MKNLTKKSCVIISVVSFVLAMFVFTFSTLKIDTLHAANDPNLQEGIEFLEKYGAGDYTHSDVYSAEFAMERMRTNNDNIKFYSWFRLVGGLLFTAIGIYFLVAANGMKNNNPKEQKTEKTEE